MLTDKQLWSSKTNSRLTIHFLHCNKNLKYLDFNIQGWGKTDFQRLTNRQENQRLRTVYARLSLKIMVQITRG